MSDQADSTTLLDVRGLICPLPVLKAKKVMKSLKSGMRLRVEATDPLAAVDIPHFCQEDGHHLIGQETQGDVQVFVIEKGA
ncbi:MAG: sulfurtransferase TusA family protein [Pseudomonadota bacterium]